MRPPSSGWLWSESNDNSISTYALPSGLPSAGGRRDLICKVNRRRRLRSKEKAERSGKLDWKTRVEDMSVRRLELWEWKTGVKEECWERVEDRRVLMGLHLSVL